MVSAFVEKEAEVFTSQETSDDEVEIMGANIGETEVMKHNIIEDSPTDGMYNEEECICFVCLKGRWVVGLVINVWRHYNSLVFPLTLKNNMVTFPITKLI